MNLIPHVYEETIMILNNLLLILHMYILLPLINLCVSAFYCILKPVV